ncbi:Component of oligomeric golgi complex 3 [Carabus blaptoides fortunei]
MHNKRSKCKYCNKFGHTVEECRKREQNPNNRQSNLVNCNNFFHGSPITYDELFTDFAYDFKFPEFPTTNPRELESSCELPVIVTSSSSSDKIVTEESKQCESNVSAKSNDLPASHSVINSNYPDVPILNNDSMGTLSIQTESIVVLDTINNIEDYQQHESTIVNTNHKNLYLTNLNEQVKPSMNFITENPATEIQSSLNVNNISTLTPVVADHTCMELVQKSTSIPESTHLHTPIISTPNEPKLDHSRRIEDIIPIEECKQRNTRKIISEEIVKLKQVAKNTKISIIQNEVNAIQKSDFQTKYNITATSDIKNEDIKNCPLRNITQESDVMPEINNKEDSIKKCQPRKNAEQSSVLLSTTNQDPHPSSIDIDLIDGRYRDKKENDNNSLPTLIQSFDTSVVKINKEIISPPQRKMATSLQSTTITEGCQHNIKKHNIDEQVTKVCSLRSSRTGNSPADLHGMWYPAVKRTLVCLSRLYRCMDRPIFQGLSQEALTICVQSVLSASQAISNTKTPVNGELFQIKHLLILGEQIALFQVDFTVSLDFSKVKTVAFSLLQKRNKLFALNGIEGTPQVPEQLLERR